MFLNIKFPFETNINGLFLSDDKTTKEVIKSHLSLLLLTQKGERFYLSDYGTNLRRFLFNQNDDISDKEIRDDIVLTCRKYIPKLTIKSIDVVNKEDNVDRNKVVFSIKYEYRQDYLSFDDTLIFTFEDFI